METGITLQIEGGREEFGAGERLRGSLTWTQSAGEGAAELSALWYTEGKGDKDTGIAHFEEFPLDSRREKRFEVELPLLPLTYHGELLKVHWVIRVRVDRKQAKDLLLELPFVLRDASPALP